VKDRTTRHARASRPSLLPGAGLAPDRKGKGGRCRRRHQRDEARGQPRRGRLSVRSEREPRVEDWGGVQEDAL